MKLKQSTAVMMLIILAGSSAYFLVNFEMFGLVTWIVMMMTLVIVASLQKSKFMKL